MNIKEYMLGKQRFQKFHWNLKWLHFCYVSTVFFPTEENYFQIEKFKQQRSKENKNPEHL